MPAKYNQLGRLGVCSALVSELRRTQPRARLPGCHFFFPPTKLHFSPLQSHAGTATGHAAYHLQPCISAHLLIPEYVLVQILSPVGICIQLPAQCYNLLLAGQPLLLTNSHWLTSSCSWLCFMMLWSTSRAASCLVKQRVHLIPVYIAACGNVIHHWIEACWMLKSW